MLHPTFPYTQVQKDWIADLESGKYPKGKLRLHSNGFCCLGVICEREGLTQHGEGYVFKAVAGFDISPDTCLSQIQLRDPNLVKKYGLFGGGGEAKTSQYPSLAKINDDTHFNDFRDVVYALHTYPERYFTN